MLKVTDVKNLEDGSIEKVENELNIKFPKDFIDFMEVNNGGYPYPNYYYIGDYQESINNFLSLNVNDQYGLLEAYKNVKDRLGEGIIPFARDAGNNRICFDFRKDAKKPRIVFCIHEMVDGSPQMTVKDICSSFSEFINMLCEYEEDEDF